MKNRSKDSANQLTGFECKAEEPVKRKALRIKRK